MRFLCAAKQNFDAVKSDVCVFSVTATAMRVWERPQTRFPLLLYNTFKGGGFQFFPLYGSAASSSYHSAMKQ